MGDHITIVWDAWAVFEVNYLFVWNWILTMELTFLPNNSPFFILTSFWLTNCNYYQVPWVVTDGKPCSRIVRHKISSCFHHFLMLSVGQIGQMPIRRAPECKSLHQQNFLISNITYFHVKRFISVQHCRNSD